MCLQCLTKARSVKKNVIPGYTLMRSTVDHKDWHAGDYGLVVCNDPDFVFKGKPTPDPSRGKNLDKDKKAFERWKKWSSQVEAVMENFLCPPERGYRLYKACLKTGYRPHRDGYNMLYWLWDYMGRQLKKDRPCRKKSQIGTT